MPFHGSISAGVKHFGLTGSSGPTNYPISITATPISSSQITLSWTNASNAYSIRIYRNGTLITTLAKGTTSYTDSSLGANTSYTYQLSYYGSNIEKKEPSTHSNTTCYGNGTYLSNYCSGTNLYNTYANGSCGTYSNNQGNVNGNCGYCDPYGTYYYDYCTGYYDYHQVFANGGCGTYDNDLGTYNGNPCGYCDPYGTYYGSYCSGGALYNSYADGGCGSYSVLANGCDCSSCGCGCGSPVSVDIGSYESGGSLFASSTANASGNTITYHQINQRGSSDQYGLDHYAGDVGQCGGSVSSPNSDSLSCQVCGPGPGNWYRFSSYAQASDGSTSSATGGDAQWTEGYYGNGCCGYYSHC